jgi:nitrite reductase/ring-hydroxylating ferredoxin subunit
MDTRQTETQATVEDASALHVVGPMPRDLGLLTELNRRKRVTHFKGPRYPYPVPNGWFIVAESADLPPGGVRPLHYFDRDLVLFRGEGGNACVLDAHCQHLGAHLAVGGKVEGACIRCPFHGWRFDGATGKCNDIPYVDFTRVPSKAHTRAYPTIERNHMIWAWYHAEDGDPFYEVPEVWEFSDPAWTPYVSRTFQINISCQDMAENNVDFAHFRYVHGTDAIPEDSFETDGTYKKTIARGGDFIREGFGLGLGVLRVKGTVTFISSTTPITAESVEVRWLFTSPVAGGENLARAAIEGFTSGVTQDIPIWENKIYRDPPIITKTEKLILEHRKWCQQFYSGLEAEATGDAE